MPETTPTTEEMARLLDLVNSLYAELEDRNRQMEAVHRVAAALFPRPPIDELMRRTLAAAIEVVVGEVGSIQLYDEPRDALIFRFVVGSVEQSLLGQAVATWEGINGRVFRSGVAQIANDVSENADFNPDIDKHTGYQTVSLLTVPLRGGQGQPIGVMQVLNGKRPFEKRDQEVLEILCAIAALAWEDSELENVTRQVA